MSLNGGKETRLETCGCRLTFMEYVVRIQGAWNMDNKFLGRYGFNSGGSIYEPQIMLGNTRAIHTRQTERRIYLDIGGLELEIEQIIEL